MDIPPASLTQTLSSYLSFPEQLRTSYTLVPSSKPVLQVTCLHSNRSKPALFTSSSSGQVTLEKNTEHLQIKLLFSRNPGPNCWGEHMEMFARFIRFSHNLAMKKIPRLCQGSFSSFPHLLDQVTHKDLFLCSRVLSFSVQWLSTARHSHRLPSHPSEQEL